MAQAAGMVQLSKTGWLGKMGARMGWGAGREWLALKKIGRQTAGVC